MCVPPSCLESLPCRWPRGLSDDRYARLQERGRRQAEQFEALMSQALVIIRKQRQHLPSSLPSMPWSAKEIRRQERRREIAEARRMAESMQAEPREAEMRAEEEAYEARMQPLRARLNEWSSERFREQLDD